MKRNLVILLVLFASVGLALAGLGFWCLATTKGARWLIDSADNFSAIEMTKAELEGSLLNGLAIKELRIAWEGGDVQAADLKVAIGRFSPFSGQLVIEDLEINRLIIQLDETVEEPTNSGDDAPGVDVLLALAPNWLELSIDRLNIAGFICRGTDDPADEVVIANLIAGRYLLSGQRLVAEDFSYHSPYVELDGRFDWQLALPHLVMTANVHLPETTVDPALLESIMVPDRFPAHLELDGDWNRFVGPVQFGIKKETGNKVWLSAKATGSWRGIRFDGLEGRYLGGAIAGALDMSWIDSYRIEGHLFGQDLNPAPLVEPATGNTTLDLSGNLFVPYDDHSLQANFDAVIHEAHFQGHALQGRAAGQLVGMELVDLDVDIAGDGVRLLARGVPAQRVDFDLEVADFAMYHADLSGKAAASGWLSWSENSLAGEIDGHGEKLWWQEVGVHKVVFQARRLAGEERVAMTLSGDDWNYGSLSLNRMNAELSGTLTDHQLAVEAETSFGHFTALTHGTYQPGAWTGRVEHLVGDQTPWGRWSMPEPTDITWDEGVLTVGQLPMVADGGARLELEVDSWGSSDRADAVLSWSGFELKWLQPYVDIGSLTGRTEGHVKYITIEGEPLSISSRVTAQGRIKDESYDLAYEKLELRFDWGQTGLQLSGTSRSDAGERLEIKATAPGRLAWEWPIQSLEGDLQWQGLNLARFNRFLDGTEADGVIDGKLSFALNGKQLEKMRGQLTATGRMMQGKRELGPRSLRADLSWEDKVFQSTARVEGARGGHATLTLTSAQSPALAWPDSGQIDLEINNLSLGALEPLLPQGIDVAGTIDSQAKGRWEKTALVDLSGDLRLRKSHIIWNSDDGQILLPLRDATAEWRWYGDRLNGAFDSNLADYGHIGGSWQLPLPARIPTAFVPDGPLQINVDGKVQATGILSALGPWLVQDIRGEAQVELAVQGTWARPDWRGKILFQDGGVYLPAAGVQLEDIQLHSVLAGDRLRIDRLTMRSGSGNLFGQGEVIFDRWRLASYHLDITGEEFEVVDFPELQMTCSPDLDLSGTRDRLALQGSILIPRLAIRGSKGTPEVLPSKDVVKVETAEQRNELEIETDIQVKVDLGEDVTVKSGGVDTRLAGGGIVTMGPTGELLAHGEIQLVSGSFRAHGVNLKIRQGLLNYQGGVITNPELRIFAAREVGDVLAGVQVTGNAEAPVVTLYSRPAMPDRDILGYMLMGRAISTESQETDMLMMGAGSLLPGYGGGLSELGITEIDIQGFFEGGGGLRLRRKLTENWEVESQLGVESGLDLYYIIELE